MEKEQTTNARKSSGAISQIIRRTSRDASLLQQYSNADVDN